MVPKDYYDERKHVRSAIPLWLATAIMIITLAAVLVLLCTTAARANPLVDAATAEIGRGEFAGDNYGPDVRRYLRGKEGLPWCAGFVSYCAKRAGYRTRYTIRAKDYLGMGKHVTKPQPGDIAVFTRNGGGHVGIVSEVTANTITTIEGNSGRYPARVKKIINTKQAMSQRGLIAYVRLEREMGMFK